MTVDDYIHA